MRTRMLSSRQAFMMMFLALALPAFARAEEPYEPHLKVPEPGFAVVKIEGTIRGLLLDLAHLDIEKFREVSQAPSMADVRKIELQSIDHLDADKLALLAGLSDWPQLDTLMLNDELTGFDLSRLNEVPWLRKLRLRDPIIPDAEFEKLAKLPRLHTLSLWKTEITDLGVARLAELCPWLTGLDLKQTLITDSVVESLGRFDRLESLDLSETAITDAGIARLVDLCPHLIKLNLEKTALTDEGLKPLCRLAHIESLDISRTNVSDSGLDQLAALKTLQMLDLSGLHLTDEGLLKLKALNKLRTLRLIDFFDTLQNMLDLCTNAEQMEASLMALIGTVESFGVALEIAFIVRETLRDLLVSESPELALGLALLHQARSPAIRLLELLGDEDLISSAIDFIAQRYINRASLMETQIDSPNPTPFSDAALADLQQALPDLKILRNAEEDIQDRLSP